MAVGGQKDVRATAMYMGTTDDEGKAARDRYLGRMRGSS